jgi:hypothetical protein
VTVGDVLEQHGRGALLPRRGVRAVIAVLLLVGLVAGAVDWKVRRHEAAAVDRCVAAALSARANAEGRVETMAAYVSPTLASSSGGLRRGLLAMVSSAARPVAPSVRRARALCGAVHVMPLHTTLRRTRDACVRLLDAELAYLAAVAEDGRRIFEGRESPRGSCD